MALAVAVSETAAAAIATAIEQQTVQQAALYSTFIAYLDLNFGQAAAVIPGSPAAAVRAQAQALNDIPVLLTSMLDQQQKTVAALEGLQVALAGVSSQIASGVTTAQVAVSDQIKMNKFKKQTANEALERAGLPPTEVKEPDFAQATKEAVDDTLLFKAQINITTLIERQISDAFSWVGLTMADLVKNSFVGDAARSAVLVIKGWLGIKEPILLSIKTGAGVKADARALLLADPVPIGVQSTATWTGMSA
jgi:hypothetical protein